MRQMSDGQYDKFYKIPFNVPDLFWWETTGKYLFKGNEYQVDYDKEKKSILTSEEQEYMKKEMDERFFIPPFLYQAYKTYQAYNDRKSKPSGDEANQVFAYDNIINWVKETNDIESIKLNVAAHEFMTTNNVVLKEWFLEQIAQYGSKEKLSGSRYVLWLAEEDEKLCTLCSKRHGKIYDIEHEPDLAHPNCRCRKFYYGSKLTPKRYLVVIFSGITTNKGSGYILALENEIKTKLLEKTPESTVDTINIATYDDSKDDLTYNDDMIGDILQVYSRAYNPESRSPWIFANQIIDKYNSSNYDYVFFVGHSGGGVMASRVAETLDRIGKGPYVNKIIRIGSPELNVDSKLYANRTLDLINQEDMIPLFHFQRVWTDQQVKNVYLKNLAPLNSGSIFDPHMAYFQHKCSDACREACARDARISGTKSLSFPKDKNIPTNMEKTVDAILGNID